jgi:hypothetical protein
MTKAKISEYDAVAANNTDVNGVNIDEGCAPSGMNNMGREIMAALKRFETGADGDSLTVGGNLIVSGTVTVTTLNTSGAVVFNDAGADVDFRVEGDTEANLLFVDAGNERVGIGTVSGTTVSYNGGNLSRWAQLTTPKDDTPLLKGTVMSNLDEMNVYIAPTTYWTEEDELPEGVNVGDVKEAEHEVENEQLNKVKVSDVEGDANVAGVFVNWTYDEAHQVDEINMAMTGDMIIRIAEGVTVARGDLLMSAGNGTAKPQGDDIVRSKTIAKVTSTHVTCTYLALQSRLALLC